MHTNEHTAHFGVISEVAIGYDGYTGIIPRETRPSARCCG